MRRFIPRRWPSPGLVVAIVALVAASGGTAVAAGLAGTGVVATDDFKARSVTTSKFRNGAASSGKLSPGLRALLQNALSFPIPGTIPPGGGGGGGVGGGGGGAGTGAVHFALFQSSGQGVQSVFSRGGLTMNMSCGAADAIDVEVRTSSDHANLNSSAQSADAGTNAATLVNAVSDSDFNQGESQDLDGGGGDPGDNTGNVVSTQYRPAGGTSVAVLWQEQSDPNGGDGCLVSGLLM
jgi:hypothetical protein